MSDTTPADHERARAIEGPCDQQGGPCPITVQGEPYHCATCTGVLEIAQALADQRDRHIKAICTRCREGAKVVFGEDLGHWIHPVRRVTYECAATAIRQGAA